MKSLIVLISLILILFSCSFSERNDLTNNLNGIYKSTSDSFQEDFFLNVEDTNVVLFGWGIEQNKDTFFYKMYGSLNKMELDSNRIRIELGDLKFFNEKFQVNNLDHKEESIEVVNGSFFSYNSFFGSVNKGNAFNLKGTKHSYLSRADNFTFEKIK